MPTVTRPLLRPFAFFCYVWLMLGFFTGTLLLLGPVRWLTTALRAREFEQRVEDVAVLVIIASYVLTSAVLAFWVARHSARCATRRMRLAAPAVLTIAAAVCLWGWMNPARLAGAATPGAASVSVGSGAEFVFGPYPDQVRLAQLKRDGYAAVISLQHPAVLPFEPAGISTEIEAAKQVGIEFIHTPMLPWVSSNVGALGKIREIAQTRTGRFYVHCGLGRDRANLVKRMLELEGTRVAAAEGFQPPRTLAARVAENRPPFERGAITEIDRDLWLLPYPNKHEFFGNLLSGQIRHVTLVLDPADVQQQRWIEEARRLFGQFEIPVELKPLRANDAVAAAAIAQFVREAPRPEAVIVPYTAPNPSTQVADTLSAAFKAFKTRVNQ